jgi:glycosyltransferase involved in cell wall biosynthesis
MRVVQIIDSLNSGGSERMAVSFANALSKKIEFSGLIATRKEGNLKKQISSEVSYLFLEKSKSLDFKAIFRLRKYLRENKIEIIHAHSSSFFIAVLIKMTLPGIKIFWHDHYGTRIKETKQENRLLILFSAFFSAIFVVNLKLKEWNKKNLNCKKVVFIPNFATSQNEYEQKTVLNGIAGKRIVFLANLKKPKNHILILKAFNELKMNESGWSLHLVGKDYFDSYSDELKDFISRYSLENEIHLHGEKSDIKYILEQSSIGVLSSTEEGFPVTLLEYAFANLAVVSTTAGYCSSLIKNNFNGLLFDPFSDSEVQSQLKKIIESEDLRTTLANNLKKSVEENYTEEIIIDKLLLAYKENK